MIRVGIIGATGYTGARLVEYLNVHPEVEIVFATSERFAGERLSNVYGRFAGPSDLLSATANTAARTLTAPEIVFPLTVIPESVALLVAE